MSIEETDEVESYIDVLQGEYSKLSILLKDIIDELKENGELPRNESGRFLSIVNVEAVVDDSGRRVKNALIEEALRVAEAEEED